MEPLLIQHQAASESLFQQCFVFVDEREIMIGRRRLPRELVGIFGFVEWNRFCDRLDDGLQPLRELVDRARADRQGDNGEENDSSNNSDLHIPAMAEERAKSEALQTFQTVCDKVSKLYPMLEFTLFCPFHGTLVENWHLQVTVSMQSSNRTDTTRVDEEQEARQPTSTLPEPAPEAGNIAIDEQEESTISPSIAQTDQEEAHHQHRGNNNHNENNNEESKRNTYYYGRSGKGVLGVDYIEHKVLPTDTLSGICLTYNISAFRLKQANLMAMTSNNSVDSLLLAPALLAIPVEKHNACNENGGDDDASTAKKPDGYYARIQNKESPDFKLSVLRSKFSLGDKEARAYLELADWVLQDAIESAQADIAWERKEAQKDDF